MIRGIALLTMPPLYIFNEQGLFIDWSNNIDDDQEFINKWSLSEKIPIELSNYQEFIKK